MQSSVKKKRKRSARGYDRPQQGRLTRAHSDSLGRQQDGVGGASSHPGSPLAGWAEARRNVREPIFPRRDPCCSRSSRAISVRKLYCNKRRADPFFKWPANSYDLPPVKFFAFSEIKNEIEKMTKKEGECRTAASLACLLHDKAIKEGKSRKKRARDERKCYWLAPRWTSVVDR